MEFWWTEKLAIYIPCDRAAEANTTVLPEETGSGSWDSLHVFECLERDRTAKYKLTSTIILEVGAKTKAGLSDEAEGKGQVNLGGSVTRQVRVCVEEIGGKEWQRVIGGLACV